MANADDWLAHFFFLVTMNSFWNWNVSVLETFSFFLFFGFFFFFVARVENFLIIQRLTTYLFSSHKQNVDPTLDLYACTPIETLQSCSTLKKMWNSLYTKAAYEHVNTNNKATVLEFKQKIKISQWNFQLFPILIKSTPVEHYL